MSLREHLEHSRFRLLLATLVALIASQALGLERLLLGIPTAAIGLSVIAATLWITFPRRRVFVAASVLALPIVREVLASPGANGVAELAGSDSHAPFFCLAAGALIARVLRSERADEETVVGSVCAYLFIAFAFASLYTALEGASPQAFRLAVAESGERLFDRLAYFSLVTITTLGYGDIVPLSPLARSLASLESVIGILFPAIVIARIVSLYTSGGGRPFGVPERSRRPGRFELLLAAELATLFATSWVEAVPGASIALALLTAGLLIVALHAGSERRPIRLVGIALAVLTIVTRWPRADPGWREASLGLEVALLGLVSTSLFLWLLREQRVTRDLLLAAGALYGLLGFAWAAAFELLVLHTPDALAAGGDVPARSDLVYFSFMTLTTTGFGDLAPVGPVAKRLAASESLLGILYPSVLVARLVALYRSD